MILQWYSYHFRILQQFQSLFLSSTQEKQPNTVEVFIQDANNNINTAYRSFKITETTTISIDFTFNNQVNSGKYIIKKDGVTIDTGVVQ